MKKLLLLSLTIIMLISLLSGPLFLSAQGNREWTIVQTFTIPGKASGLTWDGTYLYSGLYATSGDDNLIYQIDPSNGSYTLLCAAPQETTYGLSFDGTDFWSTDRTGSYTPAIAVQFDYSGNLLSSFELPATYHSGIEYDNGNFWVCCYYDPDGMVYHLDGSGNILSQFPSPNNQPWAICKENNNLWIADYNANMLYKTDTDGNLLESHASNGAKPAGVTFDGQYLWYCDGALGANSTLYKVDLGGSGTAIINIPDDSHDYGIVTVGESSTWNMLVQNSGTGNLVISDVQIPGGVPVSTTFTPPQTIIPGGSITIPLSYEPLEPAPLNTIVTVVSNDPVNPNSPVILTGEGVAAGPLLFAADMQHNYGPVRMNATTRWFLTIWNIGSQALNISDINIDNDVFYLDEGNILPISVGVLDSVNIGIWFNPDTAISYNDVMQIISNDSSQSPFDVYLLGSGVNTVYPTGTPLWHFNIDDNYDNSPKAIASIGDMNADKINEVIVGSEDDYIRCLNGNSHGIADVFWQHEIYAGSVYGQNSLYIVSDINFDNFQDVIVGTAWGDRSVIALSGKNGQQIWKHDTHEYGDGGWVYQVDGRYDYNNDGHADILAATGDDGNGTGPKRIYCLNGLTGQSIWECYTGGPNFSVIGVEDLNGDDLPDVIAGASNGDETMGKVYAINGANGAIIWTVNTSGSSVWALEQLDDLDGDNFKDVIAGDFGGSIYYLSGATGSIIDNSGVGNSLILRFVKIDDINGDGHQDILIAHSGTNAIVISGLDGSNLWLQPLADKSWCVAKSNDLNGDGISDVLIGTLYSDNFLYFLDGATGSEINSLNYGTPVDAINAIPDIVGDGSYEMVAGGRDGKVYCYSGGYYNPVSVRSPRQENKPPAFDCYPNPFSTITTIKLEMKESSQAEVSIYSAGGKFIRHLVSETLSKGNHEFSWDGTDGAGNKLRSGVYFCLLKTPNSNASLKIALIY